jgi:hypothetical protein
MRDFNGEVESRHRRLLSCLQFSMFGQPVVSDAKHRSGSNAVATKSSSVGQAGEAARCAQHAARYFNNRYVELFARRRFASM